MMDTGGGNRDYMEIFKYLFAIKKPNVLLEFGLGYGSKVLREYCNKLVSWEIMLPSNAGWFEDVKESFNQDKGWEGILTPVNKDEMTEELEEEITKKLQEIKPDMVFVDPGVHFRPEIINICLKLEIPIISAHDTAVGEDDYHWTRINSDDRYQTCSIGGQGTTVWIKDDILFDKLVEATNEKQ